MTEKENQLRIIEDIYKEILVKLDLNDFSNNNIQSLKKELLKQSINIEKMLNQNIMFGLINSNDKNELIKKSKDIMDKYFQHLLKNQQ